MDDQRAAIPGSDVKHGGEARWSPAPCDMQVGVTIYLRPRDDVPSAELLSGQFQPISREEAEAKFGASAQDMEAVRAFAEAHGLRVTGENAAARTIHVEGTVEQMDSAFGVSIGVLNSAGGNCLSYEGALTMPASLECVIVAVLGLDQQPVAKTREQRAAR